MEIERIREGVVREIMLTWQLVNFRLSRNQRNAATYTNKIIQENTKRSDQSRKNLKVDYSFQGYTVAITWLDSNVK